MNKTIVLQHLNSLFKDRDLEEMCTRTILPILKSDLEALLANKPCRIPLTAETVMLLSAAVIDLTPDSDGLPPRIIIPPETRVHLDALHQQLGPKAMAGFGRH